MPPESPVIETQGLSRRFGPTDAVNQLDIQVPKDSVFAFLGPNGAGKTTTIRMLLNILKPSAGNALLLGKDSRQLRSQDFQRIGYVSENQNLPLWMTVEQFMNYLRPLYAKWDTTYESKLLDEFALPKDRKLKHLSRGMRMKAALVGALAFRPELLVLDEPFTGLDPLVREEFLSGIVELTSQEKWTIFLSSHDIDEVERIADRVTVINDGSLVLNESVDQLLGAYRKVSVTLSDSEPSLENLPPHWLTAHQEGRLLTFVDSQHHDSEFETEARAHFPGLQNLSLEPLSLREIYLVIARSLQNKKPR